MFKHVFEDHKNTSNTFFILIFSVNIMKSFHCQCIQLQWEINKNN